MQAVFSTKNTLFFSIISWLLIKSKQYFENFVKFMFNSSISFRGKLNTFFFLFFGGGNFLKFIFILNTFLMYFLLLILLR